MKHSLSIAVMVLCLFRAPGQSPFGEMQRVIKLSALGERDGYGAPPTLVPFQDELLSINLCVNKNDHLFLLQPNMQSHRAISLKPLLEALDNDKQGLICVSAIATYGDMIYFVSWSGMGIFRIEENTLVCMQRAQWPFRKFTPHHAICDGKYLYVYSAGHISDKHTFWKLDAASLQPVENGNYTINDEQASFHWCSPQQRINKYTDTAFLMASCSHYVIKTYSMDSKRLDTIVQHSFGQPLPAKTPSTGATTNCTRLWESNAYYIGGVHRICNDSLLVIIMAGGKLIRLDYFSLQKDDWNFSHSKQLIEEKTTERFTLDAFIRDTSVPEVTGYYWKGNLVYGLHGPKNLPRGETKEEFHQKSLRYLNRKKGFNYFAVWDVD
jgi:hypothetical protein